MRTGRKIDLPVAIWEGNFVIFGVTLRCAVLDTGQRVVNADDFHQLLFAMENYDAIPDDDELQRFARWRAGQ